MPGGSGKLTQEQIEALEAHERDVKESWQKIIGEPGVQDLLLMLTVTHSSDMAAANAEVENGTRAVAALQSANAYAKIKAYITDMML